MGGGGYGDTSAKKVAQPSVKIETKNREDRCLYTFTCQTIVETHGSWGRVEVGVRRVEGGGGFGGWRVG